MRTLMTYLLGAALVGSILTNCATNHRLQAERLAHQTSKEGFAKAASAAERQRAEESENRRKAEQELRHAQDTHAQEVAALHIRLDRSLAAGRVASERLRDAAQAAAQRARAQCADPATADLGTPAGDPIGVLADVLGRADERAGILADLAERRYIAGRACERAYDAAHKALSAEPDAH